MVGKKEYKVSACRGSACLANKSFTRQKGKGKSPTGPQTATFYRGSMILLLY